MSKRLQADLGIALCSMLWGATFLVVQRALPSASVLVFNGLRFGLAALILGLVYRKGVAGLTKSEILAGSQIGFFLFAGYGFQNTGLLYTAASKAAFITGFGVVLVPLLLAVFWGRRVSAWAGVGAMSALCGLYFLVVPAGLAGFGQLNRGDILSLICAVMFALHIIFIGLHRSRFSASGLSFVQFSACAIFSAVAIPIFAATGLEAVRLEWTRPLILGVLITSIGGTAIAFTVQTWAQRYTPSSHAAVLITLEPVFAALTSYIVLKERLGGRAILGALLILAGILVSE
ncbi:MAG: DMT family transporter, partial [Acidobacteria bacterium]|nr:DMT family transporter [Acidobacteriota bacterium]